MAQSISVRRILAQFVKDGGQYAVVTEGLEFTYHVPAHVVEYVRQENGQDVGFWLSVGHGQNNFAVECAVDEVTTDRGVDPLKFRFGLLTDHPGARNKALGAAPEVLQS